MVQTDKKKKKITFLLQLNTLTLSPAALKKNEKKKVASLLEKLLIRNKLLFNLIALPLQHSFQLAITKVRQIAIHPSF